MPSSTAALPCCRSHDLFAPVDEYAQSIHRTPGDEAYWFHWASSFDGKATIRMARLGGEATSSVFTALLLLGRSDGFTGG